MDNNNQYGIVKDGKILFKGEVSKIEGGECKVKVYINGVLTDYEIHTYLSGKMKKHRIKVLEGDTVDIEISETDKDNFQKRAPGVKGRTIFRYKT